MSSHTTGWAFVAVQAMLLGALILLPGGDDFSVPTAVRVAADVLFWVGIAVTVIAAGFLGRSLTATPVPNSRAELRTSGPYRFVRHPIYSGVILVVISIAIRSENLVTLAVGAITLAFFVVKSSWEERRLAERFPDYTEYAVRTGGFFPRLVNGRGRAG